MGLLFTHNGKTFDFKPNGEIVESGKTTVLGKWDANDPSVRKNGFSYVLLGDNPGFVPAVYAFNDKNQLTATIPAAANEGTASKEFTFPGGIILSDQSDLLYELLDDAGNLSESNNIAIYGKLALSEDSRSISVALDGGGKTSIKAFGKSDWLKAGKNVSNPDSGQDSLEFKTFTDNGDLGPVFSDMVFTGLWDIQNGAVVFHSTVNADSSGVRTTLTLQGKVKGVAFGLKITTGSPGGPTLDLLIFGSHKQNSIDSSWQISLGFSGALFTTNANAAVKIAVGNGQTLTLTGGLSFTKSIGGAGNHTTLQKPLNFDLDLKAKYLLERQNSRVLFIADLEISNGRPSLNLELSGQFKFDRTTLTFSLLDSNGHISASAQLAFNSGDFKAVLNILATGTTIDVSFAFEVNLIWINGKLQPPKGSNV